MPDNATNPTANAPASDAPASDEAFDLVLPDGLNAEDLESELAVATEPPAAESKPAVGGDKGRALREERTKRKQAQAQARNLWAELESLRQQTHAGLGRRPEPVPISVGQPTVDRTRFTAQVQRVRDLLGAEAGEALESLEGMLQQSLRESQRVQQETVVRMMAELDRIALARQEQELVDDLVSQGVDYYALLREAGIWDALVRDGQGQFRDPAVAQVVFSAPNPAKRAFRLAVDKLVHRSQTARPAGQEPNGEDTASAPGAEALAEARRAGAREAVAEVAGNATRHRGVRLLRSAGAPTVQAGRTRALWDSLARMMDTNPERWKALMRENRDLDAWFMAGPPKE